MDQKPKTLILEHPLRQGYTLLNQKPSEKTPDAYRFELSLAAGATQEFAVNEERVYEQSYAVISLTPDVLLSYVQNRSLSATPESGSCSRSPTRSRQSRRTTGRSRPRRRRFAI